MRSLKLLALLMALGMCGSALAKPHTLSWEWPVDTCEGDPMVLTDLLDAELIYSTSPMPMQQDVDGPCVGLNAAAPAGSISVPIPVTPDTFVTLNLQPGQTYYARMRVSAFTDGNLSGWTEQLEFVVPFGRPNVIRFTDRAGQLTYWEIDDLTPSHSRLGGS